jgi:SAM-dependent methyltransferase
MRKVGAPGQARLVEEVLSAMADGPTRILNIGAGQSSRIERALDVHHKEFVSDRVDIDDPHVADDRRSNAHVGECWQAPVEDMAPVPSGAYGVALANYVFEHVHDLPAAAGEVRRVLRPGGRVVMSVPNPSAPQMRIAAITPLWFHRLVRRGDAWHTVYAFRTPDDLAAVFERAGFRCRGVYRYSNMTFYLNWFWLTYVIGRWYDRAVMRLGLKSLMSDACIVCELPP